MLSFFVDFSLLLDRRETKIILNDVIKEPSVKLKPLVFTNIFVTILVKTLEKSIKLSLSVVCKVTHKCRLFDNLFRFA